MFLDIFKYLLSSIFKSLEFFSIWYMIFPGNIFLMGIYIYMHSLNYSESINMYIHTHSGCSILTLFLMTFQLIFLSFADTYLIRTSHLKRTCFCIIYEYKRLALTSVAQLVGHSATKQKVPVQFPVRARAWVVGSDLSWGA